MQWGGGLRSGWATPPGLPVLLLVLLWAGSVSPAPFKEDWPETWPEATDLAFPETGKRNALYVYKIHRIIKCKEYRTIFAVVGKGSIPFRLFSPFFFFSLFSLKRM